MATASDEVRFIDVTLRDGNQSLWGAAGINNEMVESMLPFEEKAGLKAVDLVSSIHMGMSVRYFKENPWERFRTAKRILKNTPFSFGTTGRRFIGFRAMPDSVMDLVYERMVANRVSRLWISEATHDMKVILSNAERAKKAGIGEIVVALCYTISPVHTDEYYAQLARQVVSSPYVDTVYLKDQGGLLTQERVKTLIPTIRANIGDRNFEFHSHCSTALAPICYIEAVKMGVRVLHTAVPPLANGSSLPSIFNILKNIRYLGYTANVDDEALDSMAKTLSGFAEKQGRQGGALAEYDVSYYEHQLPGGMVSTMKRQLVEMKMEHRWGEIVEEVARVRKGARLSHHGDPSFSVCGNAVNDERHLRHAVQTGARWRHPVRGRVVRRAYGPHRSQRSRQDSVLAQGQGVLQQEDPPGVHRRASQGDRRGTQCG